MSSPRFLLASASIFTPMISEILGDSLAGGGGVFAHAGGEDDGVHAVHGGGIGADDLGYPVVEHLKGQTGALVALVGRLPDRGSRG
jgi:ribulose 1,5-bisphosphate carboxylase large subunit-like protein